MSKPSDLSNPPRIIYIGDVPVRALTAGSAVLYRLFESYPSDRLLLAEEIRKAGPGPGDRLPGVKTITYNVVNERLLKTRLRDYFGAWFFLRSGSAAGGLSKKARDFGAEAVVGIAHGYGWVTGAKLAQLLGVPFHLIVHDDWVRYMPIHPALQNLAIENFGKCYRQAARRLVISDAMSRSYKELYGAEGTVFYPLRSRRLLHPQDPSLVRKSGGPFTFAYAGHAGTPWAHRMLAAFANVLAPLGARLRIHFSMQVEELNRAGLRSDNVEIVPFEPESAALQRNIVAGADAMYLPMSFADGDRRNVDTCFPSKATDYTATGLPILIHAPESAAAVVWAKSRPGSACTVVSEEPAVVSAEANRIVSDAAYRRDLAEKGATYGWADFDHDKLFEFFVNNLRSPGETG